METRLVATLCTCMYVHTHTEDTTSTEVLSLPLTDGKV